MPKTNPLTLALLDGLHESPLWTHFLRLLREQTRAEFATLFFRPPGWRHDESVQLISGDFDMEEGNELYRQHFSTPDITNPDLTITGRPYSLEELRDLDAGAHGDFYTFLTGSAGVADLREMRVREPTGVSAWLTIVRMQGKFSGAAVDLLSALAPLLTSVLHTYVMLEQQKMEIRLAEAAITGLQIGWFTLDAQGQVLDADELGLKTLRMAEIFGSGPQSRLALRDGWQDKVMQAALARFAANRGSPPLAMHLRRDPVLDLMLVPSRFKFVSTKGTPAAIAYVHGDAWSSADRCQQLIGMFSLSRKEAELALALCRGQRIADAAADVGITTETARSYSKAIYAKTGTRGLSDLVRTIMGSVLAMAPQPVT